MRWSQVKFHTLKEAPSDAEVPSHQLLVRGGYVRKVAQGIFTYGPLLLRSIRKFENIVREELDRRGCVEVLMPMVQPRELWDETDRWTQMGKGLLKFKNRLDQDFCLGATHEEVITDYVRREVKSYRDLPLNLYQIQTKYRDEVRPRFGLLRGREFIMKDAYSFDLDEAQAKKSYQLMFEAYSAIFQRLGARFVSVKADSGNIGGNLSEEFHLLADSGEDALLVSEGGKFAANIEVCPAHGATTSTTPSAAHASAAAAPTGAPTLERFATPGLRTIADLSQALGVPQDKLVKTLYFSGANEGEKDIKPICVLVLGSDEANPIKIKNLLGLSNPALLLTDDEVRKVTGASPGSCGPVGLKIPIYVDRDVARLGSMIVGANEDGFHLKNVVLGRDFMATQVTDLRFARAGDPSPMGDGPLKAFRGIEVGHVFFLGTKYSKAMSANFLSPEGQSKPIEMGCYGIGVSRTVQAVVEQNHDKDGIVWPRSIAPFLVHLCVLDPTDEKIKALADELYDSLTAQGLDCFMDDRDERPGVKFKDADLLGLPVRINLGRRGLDANEIEIVHRKTKSVEKLRPQQIVDHLVAWHRS
jgi:prolyl-tRNA synthetase